MIINPIVVDMDVGQTLEIPMEVMSVQTFDMDVGTVIRISGKMQQKSVTPTQEEQTVLADSQYDGLSKVTINPIPSNYGLISWDGSILTVS